MPRYQDVREAALALFPGLIKAAKTRGAVEPASRLEAARRQLLDGMLRVVVCGEFSRGKSSLLNALLGEVNLLPVGDGIATSVVTTVEYGETEEIRVHLADERGKVTDHIIGRGELRGFVTERGNPHNEKRVQRVSIAIPSDRLKPGLVLVDTPGVSGLVEAHARATDEMVRTAHAVVFVTDITEPLNYGEEKLLRDVIASTRRFDDEDALLFVVTKIDTMDTDERRDSVERRRADIAAVLGRPSPAVRVVAVSSTAWRRYLETGAERYRDRSNFTELEDVIWATLTRRQAGMLLHGALADIQMAAESLARPLREAIRAADSPGTAQAMRSTIGTRAAELKRQASDAAPWRSALTAGMAAIQQDVAERTVGDSDGAWRQLLGRLDGLLDQQDEINAIVADSVLRIFSVADTRLNRASAALQAKLASDYGLMAGTADLARLPAPPIPEVRVRAALHAPPQMNLRKFASIESLVNLTVSSAIKVVLPLIGVIGVEELIGSAGGGIVASAVSGAFMLGPRLKVQLALQKDRAERLADAKGQVERIAGEMAAASKDFVATGARAYEDAIGSELLSRIVQERDSALESASRLDRAGPADAADVAALRRELEAELAPLTSAIEQAVRLARSAHDLALAGQHG